MDISQAGWAHILMWAWLVLMALLIAILLYRAYCNADEWDDDAGDIFLLPIYKDFYVNIYHYDPFGPDSDGEDD